MKHPTEAQMRALQHWRSVHGRDWRNKLWLAWMDAGSGWAGYSPELRQLRNSLGPKWLASFKLPNTAVGTAVECHNAMLEL